MLAAVPEDRVDDRRLGDPLTISISTPQRGNRSGSTSNTLRIMRAQA